MRSEEKRRGSPSVCQIYILIRMTYFRARETTEGEIKRAPALFPSLDSESLPSLPVDNVRSTRRWWGRGGWGGSPIVPCADEQQCHVRGNFHRGG